VKRTNLALVFTLTAIVGLGASHLRADSVIDHWGNVKAPPVPELKPVTVDPKTTALLMLDFIKQLCNEQHLPHCVQRVPDVKKLLDRARAASAMVVYTGTLTPPSEKTDVVAGVAPTASEPFVKSFLDKFLNTDLEKMLKDKGITTVIVVGQVAQGAVLTTGSEAAQRGFKVIIAVDGVSADDDYYEQYAAWQLSHAPLLAVRDTLTSIDMIKF